MIVKEVLLALICIIVIMCLLWLAIRGVIKLVFFVKRMIDVERQQVIVDKRQAQLALDDLKFEILRLERKKADYE